MIENTVKSIILSRLQQLIMKLKDLNRINKDQSFIAVRLKFQKELLLALTIGGSSIIALWYFFDKYNNIGATGELVWLRCITIGVYFINLFTALLRSTDKAYKQHILAGFYFGTAYCMLLVMITGASSSPYWYGLFFILIAWFVAAPYNYRELILHGTLFILFFICGLYAQRTFAILSSEMGRMLFLYSGTLFIGVFSAINRNMVEARSYQSKFHIKEAYEELAASNEELRAEIENHYETTQRLVEKQQFIDNILSSAPIIIWSIDLEGRFTLSEGKGLEKMGLQANERVGKSALELYKGTKVEKFVQGVIHGEITNDTIQIGDIIYDTRISPLYSESGELTGYMGVSFDVTDRVKAERELKKFKLVLDQAPGGVMIIDRNSNFEYINPFFTKLSGYTEEDLLYKNINDTLYNGNIPESRKGIIETLAAGNSWQGELLTTKKDGSTYWANTIAAPYSDEKGNIDGFIVIQQDVSEQKKMITALKEREQLHRTLIEDSLEGVVITQDFKFFFVNKVFCDMLGYEMEGIMNIEPTSILAPEDRERVLGYHRMRMQGEMAPHIYVTDFIRKDGSRFTAEMNSAPVEINGKTASYITMRDITERENLQKALLESVERFRDLAEMLPQTVFEFDLLANLTYLNQEGKTKFRLDSIEKGVSAFSLIANEDHDRMKENLRKTISENIPSRGNIYTGVKTNGERFPVMIFSSPIVVDGNTIGNRGIAIDLTDRVAIENALKESEKKYRELVETTNSIILQWDKDFLITYLNEYGLRFFGYTKEEILCKPVVGTIVPHSEELSGRNLEKLMKDIFKKPENYAHNINENMRKNGERVWISWNNTAIRDESGDIIHMFSVGSDITERKMYEEELRITKDKLEKLNLNLEKQIDAAAKKLTEVNTQLISLQKENLQSQFEVLRQQVNPHFLFNSLNVLTSLIKLEPDLAEKFTEHLSKVYRYVLENKDNDLVDLKTELDFLDAYLFLLNIRFMDKIKVQVDIPETKKALLILPLALQLLIENSIKHNTMSKKAPLMIEIFIDKKNCLNIINNLQERESHMASTGVGLNNISHRYELLEMPAPEFVKTETQFIAKIPLKSKE